MRTNFIVYRNHSELGEPYDLPQTEKKMSQRDRKKKLLK